MFKNRFLDSSILRFLDPDSGIEGIEESKKNSPRNRFLLLWNRNSPNIATSLNYLYFSLEKIVHTNLEFFLILNCYLFGTFLS